MATPIRVRPVVAAVERCRVAAWETVFCPTSDTRSPMPTPSQRPASYACDHAARAASAVAIVVVILAYAEEAGAQVRARTAGHPLPVAPARMGACDTAWTPPGEFRTPSGLRVYVETGVTVHNAGTRYLIGTPTFVWAHRDSFIVSEQTGMTKAAGVRLLADTVATPLPPFPGSTPIYTPVAVTTDGMLLAIWATSRDTTPIGAFRQDTLWESRLQSGRWSSPRPIWTSGDLAWHPGKFTVTTVDSTVVVAFPASDTTRSPSVGVAIMTRSRRGWQRRWIGTTDSFTSAAVLLPLYSSEFLVLATGSIDVGSLHEMNSIYSVRLSTADTVRPPSITLLRAVTGSHAVEPSVFRSTGGVHVVWRQPGEHSISRDSIVEATSTDEGATWTVNSAASLETNTIGLSVHPLHDGDAIAAALDILHGRIITLRRTSNRWALSTEAFHDARTIPMITKIGNRLSIMFAQTRSSPGPTGPYDAPVLVRTSRALRCEPPPATRVRERLRAPPRGKSTHK